MSHAIVVLGMHRSGTSALAGALGSVGVGFGSRLMPALEGVNDKGYWEHEGIVAIHDDFLLDSGSRWDDVRPVPVERFAADAAQRARAAIRSTIEDDLARSAVWGLKDPRMCRLLPLWEPLWGQAKVSPSFLLICRHPVEVAGSLANRPQLHPPMAPQKAGLLWLLHLIESERETRRWPRLAVTYGELLADPAGVVATALERFGLGSAAYGTERAGGFVESRLRHQAAGGDAWAGYPDHWTKPLLERVWSLCTGAEPLAAAHWAELDEIAGRVSAELAAGDPSLRAHIADLEHAFGEVRRGALEVHGAAAERERLLRRLESSTRRLEERADAAEAALARMSRSASWRLTHPLRVAEARARRLLGGAGSRPVVAPGGGTGVAAIPVADPVPGESGVARTAYFTICSKNFMAYARTLFFSLRQYHPDAVFYVALCDRLDGLLDPAAEPFALLDLADLEIPQLAAMAERYNITELNTAIKPFAIECLFARGYERVVYLDPDILVRGTLRELADAFAGGAEVVLTPHTVEPIEEGWFSDVKFLQYGIFNLGFIALANTRRVREIVAWWARRLEQHCIIKLEEGIFVDQKWVDLFPAFIDSVAILRHPGYNVAYWNLPRRRVEKRGDSWWVNGAPLRFVHFSGNRLDDRDTFSRHNRSVTIESIGDLRLLLDEYRELVYANGHERYRNLPYAFGWDGASGANLHTPKPVEPGGAGGAGATATSPNGAAAGSRGALTLAREMAGGWRPMVRRGLRAWRKYGTAHVLGRVQELVGTAKSIRALERARVPGEAGAGAAGKALLFIDWGLPRPDRDAGSVMVEALLRIFGELGYRVSFLPVNLEYQPEYTGPLEAAGVECIDNRRFKSVDAYLLAHAREVSIVFACRGPVAEPFIGGIRRLAPRARIVFDTVDLHYVRELRQAEIEGSADLKEKALASKAQELRAISRSDATAILSADELYAVREELPEAKLLYLPLIFDPIPGSQTDYAARADILFVGSFPHRPNVDAVLWFVREILPGIRERLPDLRFLAVGSAPPPEIAALGAVPGVQILGYVKDLDSLLGRVRLTVAPLRYGAGIKGKIGTSLSHGVPCVATPMAVEGMGLIHGRDCLVGEDPQSFADAVVELYSDRALWERLSAGGRDYVDEQLSIGAARRRVAGACFALELGMPLMEQVYEIGSFAEYGKHRRRLADEYRRREGIELALLPRPAERTADRAFQTPGTCAVCGSDRGFLTSYLYAGRKASDGTLLPNWREHLQCRSCGFVNRTRAAIHALYTHAPPPPEARIYLTERVTPLYDWFASRWPGVVGSEYLGPGLPPGSVSAAGVRHEDMANLSFESGSLDYILSFDVLEHVPDYGAALREAHRCLNPGGVLLFSAPFSYDREAHVVRATLGPDGAPVHLLEPEYHGNPVDPEGGALCYRYFGWDLLAELRALGFRRARALCYWSRAEGYLGGESFLLLCEKGDSRTSG